MQELYRWESVAEAGRRALGLRYQASLKIPSCTMLASCRRCVCHCTVWLDAPFGPGVHLQLLPYLYSAFHEAHRTGLPVARPLFFAAPADPQARKAEEQWLLGDAVLVSPVLRQGVTEVR